jgi:hypothetical protein
VNPMPFELFFQNYRLKELWKHFSYHDCQQGNSIIYKTKDTNFTILFRLKKTKKIYAIKINVIDVILFLTLVPRLLDHSSYLPKP